MPEPSMRRDQRETGSVGTLRADPRPARTGPKALPRRVVRAGRTAPPAGEFRAAVLATATVVARVCRTRPGEALGTLVALGAAVYVSLNALGFQDGRHPAPILPQAAPAKLAAAKLEPAAKPDPTAKTETAARAEAAPVRSDLRQAEKPAARDPIGDILRSPGDTTASVTPKGGTPASEKGAKGEKTDKADRSITSAQKALTKLGYGTLKPDGLMGPTTRAAIETFERDHKLPVTGEAAGRTLRALVARASAKG